MSNAHTYIQPAASTFFPASDWATIDAAGSNEPAAHPATVRICELYWQPTYHFVRRTWPNKSPDEALEATHEFFTRRMEKHDIRNVDRKKVRFRNWVKRAISNFLCNAWRAQQREHKRHTSLDGMGVEERGQLEPRSALDPFRVLERNRQLDRIDRVFARLEREYADRDDAEFARNARRLLVPGEAEATYAELEKRWGMSTATLKVRLYSMRQRLQTLFCQELGIAPNDEEALDRELALLYAALAVKEAPPCAKSKALPAHPSP
jgi:DNA-directed RNA polymerase specialized sigma24 family protein